MDTGYEDRFFGPDSDEYISLYPVLFVIFLLFGVTMTILVNNLLTGTRKYYSVFQSLLLF